jgi:4-amino-4-deoxy-L-arabinose transferase-like glycosyltransferase
VGKWKPSLEKIRIFLKTHKLELLLVAGLLILGAFFRLYDLSDHPFPWSGDEASVGIEATRIINGEVTDFYAAGWSGQPNWSFVPTVLSLFVFGKTFFAIRFVSALEGTFAVLGVYLLARELFGRRLAALAAGFLVAFPYHLQFSRIGVNNIVDSMTVVFVLWLTLRAIRTGKLDLYMWAGLASGLCLYTYVGSRLVLALAVLALLYTLVRKRAFLREHILHLAVFFIAVCVAISPLAFYFIRHPDIFMTRLGQESIFINNWLMLQSERSGQGIPALLWKQFTDTVLVYISQNANGNFFNYPKPYLSLVGSIFFLFGMGMTVLKIGETRMFMLLAWFWSVVIFGGVLTTSPPANTRLVMTGPAVAIFLALGITTFLDLFQKLKLLPARAITFAGPVMILLLGMVNVACYFGVYRYQNYFEDATGEYAQAFGQELQSLGPDYDYYFLGLPRIFAAFPTVVFIAPENNMYDITGESIETLVLDPEKSQIFSAIPENRLDLERIANRFPGGTWEEIYRRYKSEVLYYAYILP